MKKKHGFLFKLGVVSLILAIVFSIAAVLGGAYKKESWEQVNKKLRVSQGLYETPKAKNVILSADGVKKLEIDLFRENAEIVYGETDSVTVEYYEDYEGQTVVSVNENGLLKIKSERKNDFISILYGSIDLGFGSWNFNYKMKITLPSLLPLKSSDIKVTGGKATFKDISFGDTANFRVSGGEIILDTCSAATVEEFRVTGGEAVLKKFTASSFKLAHISGGDFEMSGLESSKPFNVRISGGSAKLTDCSLETVDVRISGGDLSVKGGSIQTELNVQINGGELILDSLSKCGNVTLKLSGGDAIFTKFPHKAENIAFDIKKSGGVVELNNREIRGGKSGSGNPSCTIKADISGGSLEVFTS